LKERQELFPTSAPRAARGRGEVGVIGGHAAMRHIVNAFVGPRAKWLVLGLWLALAALFPFAGKLQSIENDDVVNYLPETAQSTQVEQFLKQFSEGQTSTAVVVYVRFGG
jgi:RND superfamily putative drug exporter